MEARLVFLILLCIIGVLWWVISYWRRQAGEAAFAAARMAGNDEERDHYCRLAVRAGHRDACRMFCFSHPDLFEDHPLLKPFKSRGMSMVFYGHYYPSRYKALLDEEQRAFYRSIYQFKEGGHTRHRIFQDVHGRPANGQQTLSYHVHAVQYGYKVFPTLQTA